VPAAGAGSALGRVLFNAWARSDATVDIDFVHLGDDELHLQGPLRLAPQAPWWVVVIGVLVGSLAGFVWLLSARDIKLASPLEPGGRVWMELLFSVCTGLLLVLIMRTVAPEAQTALFTGRLAALKFLSADALYGGLLLGLVYPVCRMGFIKFLGKA
jgi:hypothetical protein